MSANGSAVAVWDQRDGMRFNIWSNHFTQAGGWAMAELVETDNGGDAERPQVAIDPSGNAAAVWDQAVGMSRSVMSNRHTPTTGWGTAEPLDVGGAALNPQIAMDASSSAVAVWDQWDGMRPNIWASHYTLVGGLGWGFAQVIEMDDGDALSPQVAVDSNGNAVAVWQQWGGSGYDIRSNRYTSTGGWGTAELIETDNAGWAYAPQVAVDPNGNALAVWQQKGGTQYNIWANRFTLAAGWGAAELIENDDTGSATRPQVAINPSGNAVAVWQQSDGTRENIWSNRYTPTGGWGTAELVETDDTADASGPQVAMDANGNAVAVWEQSDDIWSNRMEP